MGGKTWTQTWLVQSQHSFLCREQLRLKVRNTSYRENWAAARTSEQVIRIITQRIQCMSISPHWYKQLNKQIHKWGRRDKSSLRRIPNSKHFPFQEVKIKSDPSYGGKKRLSNKCWHPDIQYKRMKMEPLLTPYIKMNSKWIIDLIVSASYKTHLKKIGVIFVTLD